MNALRFLFFCLITIFLGSCQKASEKPLIENPVVSNSVSDEEKVCDLLSEAYNLWDSQAFDSFFNDSLWVLMDEDSLTEFQLEMVSLYTTEGLDSMFVVSPDLESAFDEVGALNLTNQEFDDHTDACAESFIVTRACIICNAKACRNSQAVETVGNVSNNWLMSLAGNVGQWIHCP
ncbi:hypothetical protein [Phaeodactylibacter sp.]|uniref:hypothetical protein n=1 Tax=Phaeodactylibacter sp. TaxID=1940289 RepID=UPI0025EEB93D|nr:hypothetical protein [Phaeodactylibacter sp.]MCI4647394.1 hypothetical protein [Phaeodactylibacter sp.]MCI5089581.1 hypothetical protein [Phaeodactylibacter sp.]